MASQIDELPPAVTISATPALAPSMSRADIWIPTTVLILMVLACFCGPALFHLSGPNAGSLEASFRPIWSHGHLLGTNQLGDDVLSQALFGGRISLELSFSVTCIGMAVGTILGVLGGYLGGVVDMVVSRSLDLLLAFPSLILVLVVSAILGPSERNLIFALSFFSIPANSRIIRSGVLKIRQRDFVTAAQLDGRTTWPIIRRHILPNVLPPLITYGLLGMGVVMIVESSLSFLGLGIPPPAPSWGNMIASGETYLQSDPALALIPAGFLFITILSLNSLGDALRSRWSGGG